MPRSIRLTARLPNTIERMVNYESQLHDYWKSLNAAEEWRSLKMQNGCATERGVQCSVLRRA